MRRTVAIIAVVCASVALWHWVLSPGRPDRWAIRSDALRQTRHILVHLPDGYQVSSSRYPLVVLLDGGDERQYSAEVPLYSRSVAVLTALETEGLPSMILVGIENRNRVRDMTPIQRPDIYVGGGGSPAFLRFIETELVPFVEARWRVGSRRILYGESYGGLFVLDAFARGRQVFTDYIAVSPAIGVWPDGMADAVRRRMSLGAWPAAPSGDRSFESSLFIIYGEKDAPLVTDYTPSIARLIESERPPNLRFSVEVLPRAGHSPPESLERGLRFVFGARRQGGTSSNDGEPRALTSALFHRTSSGLLPRRRTWPLAKSESPVTRKAVSSSVRQCARVVVLPASCSCPSILLNDNTWAGSGNGPGHCSGLGVLRAGPSLQGSGFRILNPLFCARAGVA